MEKAHDIDLPTEFKAPDIPGIDWDELHEDYLAKLEEDRFVAAVEEGIAEMRAGKMVPLEEARARLEKKLGICR